MGKEIASAPLDEEDKEFLKKTIADYAELFDTDISKIKIDEFKKYQPKSSRPYGNMYVGE